jgi:hypothetical protein
VADRSTVDLERFVREVRRVRNDAGTRGYDRGVRTFDCPLCGDAGGRGWVNVSIWTAGCFNSGCVAEPRLKGGAVEWARQVLGHATRGEAWGKLARDFGGASVVSYAPDPVRGPDYCTFPEGMRRFDTTPSPMQRTFEVFVRSQWGLSPSDAREWGLGWCLLGPYSSRVVVPVVMGGTPVGFQARTVREHKEPKYLTSTSTPSEGHPAECGRPAGAMLFNIDAVPAEGEALVVEGAGDAMAWHRGARWRSPTAVALLGVALTPEKLALLAARRLERVLVALDDEPDAQARALGHVEDLLAWGVPAARCRWTGGKDAGSGASLAEVPGDGGYGSAVLSRLRR